MKKLINIVLIIVLLISVIPSKLYASVHNIKTIDAKWIMDLGGGSYINENIINIADYSSSLPHYNQYVLDNAFDYQSDKLNHTYFRTNEDKELSIDISFEKETQLSKIIYSIQSNSVYYEGYPTKLKVEVKSNNNTYTEVGIAMSEPTNNQVCFILNQSVLAKDVRLTFVEYSGGRHHIANLMFLKEDYALDSVLNLFEDSNKSIISNQYRNDFILEQLYTIASEHPYKDELLYQIEKAQNILTGKKDINEFEYPVEVIQKTGPDNERIVLVFASDWYMIDEIDEFKRDIYSYVEQLFTYEPYKSYRDYFNIYIIETPSATNQFDTGSKNSFFGSMLGYERTMTLSSEGIEKANALLVSFKDKYLDQGAQVHNFNIHVNAITYSYAGAGNMAIKEARGSSAQTKSSGAGVMIHELSHSFGKLADEYTYIQNIHLYTKSLNLQEGSNREECKWKEFLGFRGIDMVHVNNDVYKPSYSCMMMDAYSAFCEVCKLGIVNEIDECLTQGLDMYIAKPTLKCNNTDINQSNISIANNQNLELRTVVKNYTDNTIEIEAVFNIKDSNGNSKYEVRESYNISKDETQSIIFNIPAYSSIEDTDSYELYLVEDNEIIDLNTYMNQYGKVNVKYRIGNADIQSDNTLSEVKDFTQRLELGNQYTINPVPIKGYQYQCSSIDSLTITDEQTIIHYYIPDKTKVNIRLVDNHNNDLGTIVRYVNTNEEYIPVEEDFPIFDNLSFIGLTDTIIPTGISEETVTCLYSSSDKILVDVLDIEVSDKIYDGTDQADVNVVFNHNDLILNQDYIVEAIFSNHMSGNNKDVSINITLLNDKYMFNNNSQILNISDKGNILKADIKVEENPYTDIYTYYPDIKLSDIEIIGGNVSVDGHWEFIDSDINIGKHKYSIKYIPDNKNYNDYITDIDVEVNKCTPYIDIPNEFISLDNLNAYVDYTKDKEVNGQFVFKEDMIIPDNIEYYDKTVIFIPDYEDYYHRVEFNVSIYNNQYMPYSDVGINQWYYDYVKEAYQLGLLTGATETLFKPDANMNRAMVACVFHRMEGSKPTAWEEVFSDVISGEYYSGPVTWAKLNGVINGYKNGTYKPLQNITREEMATMIYNFAKYKGMDVKATQDITGYTDYAKITPYARVTLQWAVENGLMSGKLNGTKLDPLGLTTRAEASKMLVNAYKVIYK